MRPLLDLLLDLLTVVQTQVCPYAVPLITQLQHSIKCTYITNCNQSCHLQGIGKNCIDYDKSLETLM